jgi:hypothetical protein
LESARFAATSKKEKAAKTPRATRSSAKGAAKTPATTSGTLSPEVLALLHDPNVVAFLKAVQAGKIATPAALPAQHSTPAAASDDATAPTTVGRGSAGTMPPASTGPRVSWEGVKGVEAAIAAGQSPWTAPFEFKPSFNVRGGANFAPHHRRVIEASVAKGIKMKHEFPVRWVGTYFADSFPAPRRGDADASSPDAVTLEPLPDVVGMSGAPVPALSKSERASLQQRRTFLPLAAFTAEGAGMLTQSDPPLSVRCGLTGKFFSREEVVDTLLHEAALRQYKNPFWIAPDHPRLKSGYIELKPEAKATLVPVNALVFPARRIRESAAQSDLLHPDWLNADVSRGRGMNAFTGAVSENPALLKGDFADGWATLDQLTTAGVQIACDTPSTKLIGGFTYDTAGLDGGIFATVQEFALYNADQLEKPGRLGLMRDEDKDAGSLFQSLF